MPMELIRLKPRQVTQINTTEIKKNTNKGLIDLIEDKVKNFIKFILETILNIEFDLPVSGRNE